MDVGAAVSRMGGIARTRELTELGVGKRAIASAVADGRFARIRIGHLALPGLSETVIRSHRVGGRPACATVAASHGLWMLNEPLLHIEVDRNDSRFRSQLDPRVAVPIRERHDVVLHWVTGTSGGDRLGQPLAAALRQMATCLPELDAVCAIDSALQERSVTRAQLAEGAGPAARRVFALCDGRAESGTESVFRLRAFAAGFVFRSQVEVPGGRVDFLFGERLIVEVDGSEFHSGHEAFVADRERDAWHVAIGYFVVRLTYAQVVHRWHEVESLLRLLHARGEQFWPPRIRNLSEHTEL